MLSSLAVRISTAAEPLESRGLHPVALTRIEVHLSEVRSTRDPGGFVIQLVTDVHGEISPRKPRRSNY